MSVHLSVYLVVRRPFAVLVFVFISNVGVQRRNAFIPTLGSEGPQWGPVELLYLSVRLSVSLYGCPHQFLAIIHAARNCAQRMRPQATGSNSLSGSIICPSVRASVCPSVHSSVPPSVRTSVHLSVHPSVHPSGLPRAFAFFVLV